MTQTCGQRPNPPTALAELDNSDQQLLVAMEQFKALLDFLASTLPTGGGETTREQVDPKAVEDVARSHGELFVAALKECKAASLRVCAALEP